mgnify:FL=1
MPIASAQADIDALLADPIIEAAAAEIPAVQVPEAIAPAATDFISQDANGRWSLSRPIANQPPEVVASIISELDRLNAAPTLQASGPAAAVQGMPQAAPEAGALPNQLTPEEKPGRSGKKAFESSVKYSVDTEDGGIFDATVHRTKDGAVVIQHSDGLIEHNAAFADGKSDEDLLRYSFEPIGFNSATQNASAGDAAITTAIPQSTTAIPKTGASTGTDAVPDTTAIPGNAVAPSITRIKGGKLDIAGFSREDVADSLKTAKIAATVTVGKDGRVLVSATDRSGNPAPISIKQQNAIETALMGKESKPKKARTYTGNLRNDVNLIAPGLYAEVQRGGDGEGIDGLDMSLVAEKLRGEGFMLPKTETGKDSDAVIEIIRQDIANGGGTLNEARMTAAMTEAEQKAHRADVLRLADEYGIETKRGIIPRRLEDIEAELEAAIIEETGIAAKSTASVRDAAIAAGISAEEVDALIDQIADFHADETSADKFVLMYREQANAIQERIDANQEREGRDGQDASAVEHISPQTRGEVRPALELAGQTAAEARAEIEQQEAAEAQRRAEEDRASAAERQARIDAEIASRQDVAADNFTLDAQVNDKAKQKKADAKRIDEQLAGQGDIFGAINEAANQAATSPHNDKPEPTPAQKEAGNYALGHLTLHGLNISIENPKGSERVAVDGSWRVPSMPAHYGYIKGTVGADKDHLDVFIGPNPESMKVWIINQIVADSIPERFDEHKVMLGFDTAAQAKATYLRSFEDAYGSRVFGSMTSEIDIDTLKAKIESGELSRKQFAGPVEGAASTRDQNQEPRAPTPVAESQAPATSEPGDAGVAPGRDEGVPERQKDAKGNPIYKIGERVE